MTLIDAKKEYTSFNEFYIGFDYLCNNTVLFKSIRDYYSKYLEKKETKFVEYQRPEQTVYKVLLKDRNLPVDQVLLNQFNSDTDSKLEQVDIISGPDADSYTRMFHALAITMGNKIYFRNGAYKPETEEGRKLLAHELTHVSQNKNKPLADNRTKDELEEEAEKTEQTQKIDFNKYLKKKINNKEYLLTEEQWQKIENESNRMLEAKIEQLEYSMSEKEYMDLLLRYEKWLERESTKCQQ